MLERRSPLHQGMALHMSDASTAGLRVLAVLHSTSGAAAEQAVLWPLCAQLQRLGQKVLVLDGSQAESFHTPGLAQLLAKHAWQAQAGLRTSVGDAQSVASLPARMGLKQLKASADEMGLDVLTALQAYVRGYTTVIIYASSETLTPLLQGQGLQPLLVVPPDSEHLLESYRQLKHLAVFAGVECTIAALEAPLTADGPQKYDWSRKQSSSQTAKQNAQTRLQRLNALLQCSQRHLGDAPVLMRLRWRQAGDLHQLTLHMLKTACILPMHAQPTAAAAPESLVWSH
ncbi:hypothetical protein [Comamonas testosteroni]|uniref:Uncharacterized protein n=1 Tax=Comamonas testosteroni TaxID=285 RepID=A0A8B4RX13_COMTE|nr:hypothetical protein [Comamonas testosteroni]EHN64603.1 hypothetical protein CTATCC11996_16339 [Comamonas testosteroni ATCC 11996]QQN70612.1 hypothetical protein IYN88_04105 [Comamonas testosteroni]SUY73189.1 Uncharacterised protein [Comamonas testosteroni]